MDVRGVRRTFTYRLYPAHTQAAALDTQVDEACRLYNAALDERRSAWRLNRISIRYLDQANQLKAIRANGDVGGELLGLPGCAAAGGQDLRGVLSPCKGG